MSKEEFVVILERQQKSGLSVKDFCANESYTLSSFHYWKSKFGLTRSNHNYAREIITPGELAPISFNLPEKRRASLPKSEPGNHDEIMIKLPSGVQVSFKGNAQAEIAMKLLNQIFSTHV